MWNFQVSRSPSLSFGEGRGEASYLLIEYSKTGCISFFGVSTHQLHAEANAENGLLKVWNYLVQLSFTEIIHRSARLPHSGEDDLVSCVQFFSDICHQCFYSKA